MTRSLCFLSLLLLAANTGADARAGSPAKCQTVAGRPASCGYVAEVEVSLGGITRHGRIIVTADGCVNLEHLDDEARLWVSRVFRPELPAAKGWDDRARRAPPVRRVWGQVEGATVLTEVHAPNAWLKISQHKFLAAR